MTRFLLVRHAPHAQQGRTLVGRTDVPLSDEGTPLAAALAERLAGEPLAAVQASPRLRTRSTAAMIADRHGLAVETAADLDEIDFGAWTGKDFDALEPDPGWRSWNAWRTGSRPPGGETMLEVQGRMLRHLEGVRARRPDGTVALVSHGDPIRAVLAFWLGIPLDLAHRLEVDPASVSRVELSPWGPRVLSVNETLRPGAGV
ncbi:histidine phosphatase family protein [Rhodospirillum centenum]|uniref:Phosphoglycerate mutase family protein n=1 Tax=Rhodospirillum centenum (strain ATCC 51521 / SW) TaxID=414684 RepID=B6IRW4_RHOCS|nr:histidine phosphatase family protein [Rhodospirillum centenum]ACI98200.1 phosphoglycerate mutase family protein [Rhodospirillum centenum SW]